MLVLLRPAALAGSFFAHRLFHASASSFTLTRTLYILLYALFRGPAEERARQ